METLETVEERERIGRGGRGGRPADGMVKADVSPQDKKVPSHAGLGQSVPSEGPGWDAWSPAGREGSLGWKGGRRPCRPGRGDAGSVPGTWGLREIMPLKCRTAQKTKWRESVSRSVVSDSMGCSRPAALSVGILQARILGWVAVLQNLGQKLQRTNAA